MLQEPSLIVNWTLSFVFITQKQKSKRKFIVKRLSVVEFPSRWLPVANASIGRSLSLQVMLVMMMISLIFHFDIFIYVIGFGCWFFAVSLLKIPEKQWCLAYCMLHVTVICLFNSIFSLNRALSLAHCISCLLLLIKIWVEAICC